MLHGFRIRKFSIKPFTLKNIFYARMSHRNSTNKKYSENIRVQEEFQKHHVNLSTLQKTILGIGSSIVSLYNPRRTDMLACCAEIFCMAQLRSILKEMQACIEGSEVLKDKPRIFTEDTTKNHLCLPENTFGYSVGKFYCENNVVPVSDTSVKFIADQELAYIVFRCRQIHDFLHVLLNIPTNRVGEITIKWIEALNMGFPTGYLAAIVGCGYVNAKDRKNFINYFLPLAIRNGSVEYKFYNIYWEQKFEYDLESLRSELGVEAF